MLINITNLSNEPIHAQIYRQLAEKILSGDLAADYSLPMERSLASQLRVGVNAVRRAYQALQDDGLIGQNMVVVALNDEQKQALARQRLSSTNSTLKVVDTFAKLTASVFDVEKLRQVFEETLQTHMDVRNVHFALHDEQSGDYHFMAKPVDKIQANDPFLQAISRLKVPTRIEELGLASESSGLVQILTSHHARLVYPLRNEGRLLGIIALTGKKNGARYSVEELNLLMVLINQFVAALTTARFYGEALEKRRMEEDMNMARQIQASLLPSDLPDDEKLSLAAHFQPTQAVGGDFYDYLPLDDQRFAFVIADACGKGLPAAMIISQIQATIHSEIVHTADIKTILTNVNRQLIRFTPKDKFVTLFLGIFNRRTNTLEYASAGHNYPILIRQDGSDEALSVGGPGLGIFSDALYKTGTIDLNCGDSLFLYTDGVTEAMNLQNEEYGEQRLINRLKQTEASDAQTVIEAVLNDLNTFEKQGKLHDDRTIVVLKVK